MKVIFHLILIGKVFNKFSRVLNGPGRKSLAVTWQFIKEKEKQPNYTQ
jgi:hypothetical protein